MASVLSFLLLFIFIYLAIYGISLFAINLKALVAGRKFLSENSPENFDLSAIKQNKICVIIYANSKTKHLENILNNLNNQTYDRQNYSVHVVFAKDSNSLLYTPDFMSGAMIHCIENEEYFGKNKALNVFCERLIKESKFDAYVFLGADRYIEKNYLEHANFCLNRIQSGVITGKTSVLSGSINAAVIGAREQFKNETVNITRRMFEFSCIIDSENCVFTADILEKTGRVCFETKEDELKYSLFLASNGIKPLYSPYLQTFVEIENYNPTSSEFGVRFALFKYYLKLLPKKNRKFVEFVLSMLQPNITVFLILYFALFYFSLKSMSGGFKYVIHLGIFCFIAFSAGLIASKLKFSQIFFFFLYPFYSFAFNFKKITNDFSKRAIQKSITEEKNVKSATMDASVTDGTKNVMCKMDLISEDGMRRVILRFRKKRIISDESIRMYDALKNISKRVKTHGLTLKVCQNCKYFKSTQDGTVDLLKGVCNRAEQSGGDIFDTLIWNSCIYFKAAPFTNVIEELGKKH